MRTYYHVTQKSNLPSIMKDGLLPKIGTLSALCNENSPRIYLFPTIDDMEIALSNWFGETIDKEFGENTPFCSLKITLPDDFPIYDEGVGYELYSYTTISPKYICYLKDE